MTEKNFRELHGGLGPRAEYLLLSLDRTYEAMARALVRAQQN